MVTLATLATDAVVVVVLFLLGALWLLTPGGKFSRWRAWLRPPTPAEHLEQIGREAEALAKLRREQLAALARDRPEIPASSRAWTRRQAAAAAHTAGLNDKLRQNRWAYRYDPNGY